MWFRRRKPVANDPAFQELVHELARQRMALKAFSERLDAAEAAHERLRGRFYATGAHKTPQIQPNPSKADILREFGFRPGQPVPHK